MDNREPWYGVRMLYQLTGTSKQAYEERVMIVRADDGADAVQLAEQLSKSYESDTTKYLGDAMAFHIFDENGPCLGPGTEVFSLIRESELEPNAYVGRFHDTGNECSETIADE